MKLTDKRKKYLHTEALNSPQRDASGFLEAKVLDADNNLCVVSILCLMTSLAHFNIYDIYYNNYKEERE